MKIKNILNKKINLIQNKLIINNNYNKIKINNNYYKYSNNKQKKK